MKNLKESSPLVSIIIPNYNGKDVLIPCIKSLFNSDYKNIEIVVVDNGSTDDSVNILKINFPQDKYPGIKIVELDKNYGFSCGINRGVQKAEGKYVVFFNNDMEVEPDWLNYLVEIAETDRSVASIQPKIKSIFNKNQFDYSAGCGGLMDRYGYAFALGRIFDTVEIDNGYYDTPREIFWSAGMFTRRDLVTIAGLLDEDYFAHYEEIDLCFRFHLMGYKIVNSPKSVIYHYNAFTIPPKSFKKMYLNQRNSLITLLKNYSVKSLIKYFTLRLFFDMITITLSWIKGDFLRPFATIKALLWIKLHFRKILKKRKQTQELRVVSDKIILKKLYPHSIVLKYFLFGKKTVKDLEF